MAIVNGNLITQNLRGSVGKQIVFRRRNGKTIACKPPAPRKKAALSAREIEIRSRFLHAMTYAKMAMKDPMVKAAYQAVAKPCQSAYNVAFNDAYKGPEILQVSAGSYNGQVNDLLLVAATDDFKVEEVKLSIFSPDEILIEEGVAKAAENGFDWIYKASVANPQRAGSTIIVTARDLPGNRASFQLTLT